MTVNAQPRSRPDVVPYITAWSGEQRLTPAVIATARGIAYPDEVPLDRDADGALWVRRALHPGRGRPRYSRVHPQRQRRAMARLLCQICGSPADRDEHGVLWLLEDDRADWAGWPEGLVTVHPPVCLPCAPKAAGLCPHLRGTGAVAVRVRDSSLDGVHGQTHRLHNGRLVPDRQIVVLYEQPEIRWTLAAQAARNLNGCTLVDLHTGRLL
ncbi:hypothetical protein SAMN05192584_11983 [Streptomyces pini]|uniref:Uncharacterized protein n=1 Tax=Streptomyces pini TaxID=1520580 RepID=A0A1I4HZI9_9ACTN|nr:hypothetical protein SAMN05192584_11983 [Streptomyces pini]